MSNNPVIDRADACAGNSEETMTAADEFAANEIKRLGVLCPYDDEQRFSLQGTHNFRVLRSIGQSQMRFETNISI